MNEGGCHVFFLTHCFWLHECFMFCVCWFRFLLYPFLVCSVLFLLVSYLLSLSLVCVSVSPLIFPGYRWSWEWDRVLSAATTMLLSWGNVGSPCPACYPGKLCVPRPGPNSACHGYFDSQNFLSLSFLVTGNIFWVWIMLKYWSMLFCFIEKLALELESFCPMSGQALHLWQHKTRWNKSKVE